MGSSQWEKQQTLVDDACKVEECQVFSVSHLDLGLFPERKKKRTLCTETGPCTLKNEHIKCFYANKHCHCSAFMLWMYASTHVQRVIILQLALSPSYKPHALVWTTLCNTRSCRSHVNRGGQCFFVLEILLQVMQGWKSVWHVLHYITPESITRWSVLPVWAIKSNSV